MTEFAEAGRMLLNSIVCIRMAKSLKLKKKPTRAKKYNNCFPPYKHTRGSRKWNETSEKAAFTFRVLCATTDPADGLSLNPNYVPCHVSNTFTVQTRANAPDSETRPRLSVHIVQCLCPRKTPRPPYTLHNICVYTCHSAGVHFVSEYAYKCDRRTFSGQITVISNGKSLGRSKPPDRATNNERKNVKIFRSISSTFYATSTLHRRIST